MYRALEPLKAMSRRGHEVIFPASVEGAVDPPRLMSCDVVHVYRRSDPTTRRLVGELVRRGIPIIYDNDDDYTVIPRAAAWHGRPPPDLKKPSEFAATAEVARLARIFTTTREEIAARYRGAGITRTEVIGNFVATDSAEPQIRTGSGLVIGWADPGFPYRPPAVPHEGIVVGWVAGIEHRLDAERLKIGQALRRLQAKHEHVRVECIGVDLRLPDAYRHDDIVLFAKLPSRISGFDIGIAPLLDIPFNRARSDIKLKEYAICGVPWLASPVGPYRDLGEDEGGRLVSDGQWFEALDRLVTDHQERERLASTAKRWGERNTIDAAADRWEQVFVEAAAAGQPAVQA
jgi:glycosyltransferase involved in cell wall biosynthesis